MMRLPRERAVLEELFGRSAGIAVVDLPGRIEALLAGMPPGHSYTAEEVIRGHTTLPYYLRFVSRDQATEAEERLRLRGCRGLPDLLGIRASTVPTPTFLHFCPGCAEQDQMLAGVPCWRRVHQLPGVLVCPDHALPLWRSGVRRSHGNGRHVFHSLGSARGDSVAPLTLPVGCDQLLLEIARDTLWLLTHPAEPEGLDELRQRYARLLQAQGWMRSPKRVRMTDLREAFLTWAGNHLLASLGCELRTQTGEHDWLARLLRKPRAAQHPLHHLLLIRFLGLRTTEFFATPISTPTFTQTVVPAGPSCPNPVCASAPDRPRMQHGVVPGTNRCGHCGFTYRPAEGPGSRRVVLAYGPVWEGRLRELVADPAVSLRGAARLLGVDPRTLQRHARRLRVWREEWGTWAVSAPARQRSESAQTTTRRHRACWLRLRVRFPTAGTQELRRWAPASYSHLYRYDREWLDRHRPPGSRVGHRAARVDWPARDAEMRVLAEAAAERIRLAPGRPIRVRRTTLFRAMGNAALLEQHLERLPLTAAYVAHAVESRVAYARRKVAWTVEQYVAEGVYPAAWSVVRRAGLRPALAEQLATDVEQAIAMIHAALTDQRRVS